MQGYRYGSWEGRMRKQIPLIIAALCITPATAADVSPRLMGGAWLAKREPPPSILKRGERVLTWLALDISPEGLLVACHVKQSSGYPSLDDYACNLFKEHGRFSPARDASGNAVPGVMEQYLTWEASKNATDADSSRASAAKPGSDVGNWVNTEDLPRGLMRSDEVVESSLALTVSAKGRVTRCDIWISSARPELDRRACELMIIRGHYAPARDAAGNPVQGVDWQRVRWQVPKD